MKVFGSPWLWGLMGLIMDRCFPRRKEIGVRRGIGREKSGKGGCVRDKTVFYRKNSIKIEAAIEKKRPFQKYFMWNVAGGG